MLIQVFFLGLGFLVLVGGFMLLRGFAKILFRGVKRTNAGSYYASVGNRRAAFLIGFYETMTPILKMGLIVFGASMPVFLLAATGSDLKEYGFEAQKISVGVIFFVGIPWLMGRGYFFMEREAVQRLRQQSSHQCSDAKPGDQKSPVIDI